MIASLTLLSVTLSAGCASFDNYFAGAGDGLANLTKNDFCQLYGRVYSQPGDSAQIKAAIPRVRRAIDTNEAKYLCICKQWDNPVCKTVTPK